MTTAELGDTGASAENLVFRVMGIDVLLAEIVADRQVGDPFASAGGLGFWGLGIVQWPRGIISLGSTV